MTLTFVVGTGRCGSTMLSKILHEHADVLSVSEFFSALKAVNGRPGFPAQDMDGHEFWTMLATPAPVLDAMVRDGLKTAEMCYPYGSGRFDVGSGVPAICHQCLPMLTDDPDALFDRLAAEVPAWPKRSAAAQYRALFSHLTGLFGRQVIVERSGASLVLVPLLRRQFPDAHFVHMYRDGPDCALSMSRHPAFRRETLLAGAMRATGLSSPQEIEAALPGDFSGLVAPPFDAERLMAYPIPVDLFGRQWWSAMVRLGMAALGGIPDDMWINLKYEDLLSDPATELSVLAEFLGVLATPGWLDTARHFIDRRRTGTAAAQLDPATLASLRAACEPGMRAIAGTARRSTSAAAGRGSQRAVPGNPIKVRSTEIPKA